MSQQVPPPYTEEKTGPPPEMYPPQQGYAPPPQQGYAPPPQQGYPPPQQQGYIAPEQGYPPQQQGYPPQQQGYAPPPQGYPPAQAPVAVVVAQPPVTQVTVVTSFGNNSQRIVCTNCKTEQATVLRKKIGLMNWLVCGVIALVLFLFGFVCFIPLAFIALCIPGLQDVEHVCPNCNHTNGVHKQL